MVRGENGNGDTVQDGADEKMLGHDDKETLALKNVEVKFISGDPSVNGDAKIDIGNIEKVSWQIFKCLFFSLAEFLGIT